MQGWGLPRPPCRMLPNGQKSTPNSKAHPRASIPSAILQFYRGLDPKGERAWIVRTDCCNTVHMCTDNNVLRM